MRFTGMKSVLLVLVVVAIFCQPVSASQPSKLAGEFYVAHLANWVAAKMEIAVELSLLFPAVVLLPIEDLQKVYEEKIGELPVMVTPSGEPLFALLVIGFYFPPENTIYLKEDFDSGNIVHELVHYFQHNYFHTGKNSPALEEQAQGLRIDYCQEHGCLVE